MIQEHILSESRKLTFARFVILLAPKRASLRNAGFAARVVVLGCGFVSCARVWLFEDFD